MPDQNEKAGCALSGEHGPWVSSLATLRCERCGNTPVAAWQQARRVIADRDVQIAEAESAAAGALAQIVEMRAEINQISEERTTEVDGLRERAADAEKQAKDAEAANLIHLSGIDAVLKSWTCLLNTDAVECGHVACRERHFVAQYATLTRQLATMRSALLAADAAFKSIKARTDNGQIARAIAAKGITDIFLCLAAIGAPATAGRDILVEAGEFFGVSANSSDAPPIDTALPVGYEECPDCDAAANYHRDGVAHCAKCRWPPHDCDGHPEPEETPVPKVLHCPRCGLQHVDVDDDTGKWATTRLHRKHLCKPSDGGCGQAWRPFDYPTVGVREVSSRSSITTTAGDAGGVRSDHSAGLCAPAIRPLTADEARKRADGCESEALRHVRGFAPDVVDGLRSTAASWRRYANLLERGDALERAAQAVVQAYRYAPKVIDDLRSVLQRTKENR